MKKIIITSLAVFVAVASFAQGKFAIGAGWGFDPISYSTGDNQPKMLGSANINATYELTLGGVIGLQTGVAFRHQGIGDKYVVAGYEHKWSRGMIQVPVKAALHFGNFFLNAGPTASFYIYNKTIDNGTSSNVDKDGYNSFQLFLGAGFGYDFGGKFRVGLSYDFGVLNYLPKDASKLLNDMKVHNQMATLGIAYLF